MAFRLKPPYPLFTTPVYRVNEEDGVNGRANKNGTITINSNLNCPAQEANTISHEQVHVDQMKAGELDYEDNSLTWKGKTYARKNGKIKYKGKWIPEGSKKFPWEQEAYDKEIPIKTSTTGYKRNSKDVNEPCNIIPGGDITMKGVDFKVLGTDDRGSTKVMYPGHTYNFRHAKWVKETPIK